MAELLLVEDDVVNGDLLAALLRLHGHTVSVARNGREALDALAGGLRPDLILLDLMMPVMNGWEFRAAQRAAPELRGIPVLILSGAGDEREAMAKLGALGALRKPFKPPELLDEIARHCAA